MPGDANLKAELRCCLPETGFEVFECGARGIGIWAGCERVGIQWHEVRGFGWSWSVALLEPWDGDFCICLVGEVRALPLFGWAASLRVWAGAMSWRCALIDAFVPVVDVHFGSVLAAVQNYCFVCWGFTDVAALF